MQHSKLGISAVLVGDGQAANTVFRDRNFHIADIVPYLERLQQETGRDFSMLVRVARSSLVFQNDAEHLQSRGLIARFFRERTLEMWDTDVDACLARAIERFAASPSPDVVHDFTDPLFIFLVDVVFGVPVEEKDEETFIRWMTAAREVTEPLLSLRKLDALSEGFGGIMSLIDAVRSDQDEARCDRPTLHHVLLHHTGELAPTIDPKALLATLIVACHTMAETLAYIIWGGLQGADAYWQSFQSEEAVKERLEDLLARYGSTLYLFRIASGACSLGETAVAAGDLIALDMPRIRHSVTPLTEQTSLSFGAGPHRCPGAALSRLVIRKALPQLARAFPSLRLKPDGVRFQRTRIIEAPLALPCTGVLPSRRGSARVWDVRSATAAEQIVSDDTGFGPPGMLAHLAALQQGRDEDFSLAARFARNALFFLHGQTHLELRKTVSTCLAPARNGLWDHVIAASVARRLDALRGDGPFDLVRDFCWPLFTRTLQPIFGLVPADEAVFNAQSGILQRLLKPLLSVRDIRQVQSGLAVLVDQINPAQEPEGVPRPFLQSLIACAPASMDRPDCVALTLILYGASFNVYYTLANALQMILNMPQSERGGIGDPDWITHRLEGFVLPKAHAPKYIYRQALKDQTVEGVAFKQGDTACLHLADINAQLSDRHLSFGHGVHHCVGAALSRHFLQAAIPPLFRSFPGLCLDAPIPSYEENSQTVAPQSMPCHCE